MKTPKGWKKTKSSSVGIVYSNINNKYQSVDAWIHISGKYWIISISNKYGMITKRIRKSTKKDAEEYLIKYIRKHPNG